MALNTEYDIEKAFRAIEDELISSMMRNLEHHRAEETELGFNWTQWQVEQIKALEKYKAENKKKFSSKFIDINDSIDAMIFAARQEGGTEQEQKILKAIKKGLKASKASQGTEGAFFRLNTRKLNALIKATKSDFSKAEKAMLRMSEDKYRQIIFNAQVYAATGAGTYEKAVDMATKDFLKAGINCIEYKNGSRHTVKDYARMAIQTANKRAYLTGEGEMRQSWGISTVILNKRANACPKCLPFVGKVLIDDVWSGGSAKDGPYPLMSSAMAAGLYHPNCKDVHTTYFPELDEEPDSKFTKEDLEKIKEDYRQEQKQQYAGRMVEQFDRLERYSLDPDNKKLYAARKEQWENVRFKTGTPNTDDYVEEQRLKSFFGKPQDITKEWKTAKHQDGNVEELLYYVVGENKYIVDGRHVKLDYSKHEKDVAENIAHLYGKQVKMIPRVLYPQNISTPDYEIEGEKWDLKTISTVGKNVFYNAIKKKKKQSDNFIFDITGCGLSMPDIERQTLDLFRTTRLTNLNKIALYKDSDIIKVYERNKK